MIHRLELLLDDADYDAVQGAMGIRQSFRCMPDPTHDDANLPGMLLAEICRGWMEMPNAQDE